MSRRWKGEGAPPRPLILAAHEAKRIAAGRKTQLRRLARTERLTGGLRAAGMKPGSTHDVQISMQDDPIARILVTDVEAQALVDITFEQARAEGHKTRAGFAAEWMLKHDPRWPLLEEDVCPVCDGHTTVDGEPCPGDCDEVGTVMVEAELGHDDVLKVFTARHSQRWVWVVTFELAQHLYLHEKSWHGYTANPAEALLDAGEVLGPPSPRWQENAARLHRETLRSVDGARLAGLRTEEERLAELRAMAAERNVDIDSDLKVIRHRANAIERKVRAKTEREAA